MNQALSCSAKRSRMGGCATKPTLSASADSAEGAGRAKYRPGGVAGEPLRRSKRRGRRMSLCGTAERLRAAQYSRKAAAAAACGARRQGSALLQQSGGEKNATGWTQHLNKLFSFANHKLIILNGRLLVVY